MHMGAGHRKLGGQAMRAGTSLPGYTGPRDSVSIGQHLSCLPGTPLCYVGQVLLEAEKTPMTDCSQFLGPSFQVSALL